MKPTNQLKHFCAAFVLVLSFNSSANDATISCNKMIRAFITMSKKDRDNHAQGAQYISSENVLLKISNDGVERPEIGITFKTRGQSSIKAPRKNFSFKVVDKEGRKLVAGTAKGSELLFTSMWQDLGYISNKIGYRFMSYSGLAPHPVEYGELLINGETNGLYLITKSMKDIATKDLDSPLVIRRRYFGQYEVAAYKSKNSSYTEIQLSDRYRQLMDLVSDNRKYLGNSDEFYKALGEYIDLDQYFAWLASNYLLKNGDYADEVFFYAETKSAKSLSDVKFKILPWDLDDLFKDQMHWQNFHPGNIQAVLRNRPTKDLIYNYETDLDRALMRNAYTRKMYRAKIAEMLAGPLSEKSIRETIEATRQEITPYLTKDILAASAKDSINEGKPYTKESILALLEQREKELIARRAEMVESLKINN